MNLQQQILTYFKQPQAQALPLGPLARVFATSKDNPEFLAALKALEDDVSIILEHGKYYPADRAPVLVGRVLSLRGARFLVQIPGENIFLTTSLEVICGDTVAVRPAGRRSGFEITRILKRELTTFVAEALSNRNYGKPLNEDIGDRVVLPKNADYPPGTLLELTVKRVLHQRIYTTVNAVLGHKNDIGMDIVARIVDAGVPYIFPEPVLAQARSFRAPDLKTLNQRVDLSGELIYTIDGADAKDFDDAIGVERLNNGNYRLLISIADVAHYVRPHTELDLQAQIRGTSIYLVNQVIPMLPHELSDDLCSLIAGVPRLTLTLDAILNARGQLISYELYESYIVSKHRLTYDQVNTFLTTNSGITDVPLATSLSHANQLANLFKALRLHRGAINLVTSEAKFTCDKDGKIIDIVRRKQLEAEELIEELMIFANEVVARHLLNAELPAIFRVHEPPSIERTANLLVMLKLFRYHVRSGQHQTTLSPHQYQQILASARGTPEEMVLNTLILRSFAKARYSHQNLGHFGLASGAYTHFTSPIRRYPDLLVHRLLKLYLFRKQPFDYQQLTFLLDDLAKSCSAAEKRAITLERNIEEMKKAEYMLSFIGTVFPATIVNITNFGMFLELENTVQGLARYANMEDDYYIYDEAHLCATGTNTKTTYRIGNQVQVRLIESNPEKGEITFEIVAKGSL